MTLRPLVEALAENPARSDRDLRLGDVIAVSQRIRLRIEHGEDATLLVFLERKIERKRGSCRSRETRAYEPPQR